MDGDIDEIEGFTNTLEGGRGSRRSVDAEASPALTATRGAGELACHGPRGGHS